MNYPLISEYIEAIRAAEVNLKQLAHLRPVLDGDGNPVMSSGNFSVVFKMRSERDGKCYALKCFIKDQQARNESYRLIADELEFVSSDVLVPIKFYDKELFVDTTACSETEFPVVVMDWVEGITLDRYVRQNLHDQYALQMLSYQFCRMASWLMSQPFAHGDLKPDNILVRDDGSLVLVDYDGMYVPAMQSQKARDLGSPDYRHPAQTEEEFNEHIDDFPLAAIAMQLCAISLEPSLLPAGQGDTLLLTEADHRDLTNSDIHAQLHPLLSNPDFERLYALYHLAHAQQTLSNTNFRNFLISKPQKNAEKQDLSTKVSDKDLESGVWDEFGALYSADGSKLLKGTDVEHYHIRQGTKVICDSAFGWGDEIMDLNSITIPESVTHIGDRAFTSCKKLISITLPKSIIHLGENPFESSRISRIKCYSQLFESDENALYTKGKKSIISFINKEVTHFSIPKTVTHISDRAFSCCYRLSSIEIPNSVTFIGDTVFNDCYRLKSIVIPKSVSHIGENPFLGTNIQNINCQSTNFEADYDGLYTRGKKSIIAFINNEVSHFSIPDSVTSIGKSAFYRCFRLTNIILPNSVTYIGDRAFCNCRLFSIIMPDSVTYIGNSAFQNCHLISVKLPDQLRVIGNHAFHGCKMTAINIPNLVTSIGDGAFSDCKRLTSITIPSSVIHIGENPFSGSNVRHVHCKSYFFEADNDGLYTKMKKSIIAFFNKEVTHFSIPNSVTYIGNDAFSEFDNLTSITIPNSVKSIGNWAFYECKKLNSISIPNSVTSIGKGALCNCRNLESITIPNSVSFIGERAFSGCGTLTSICIPNSVTYIADSMFYECFSLTSIIIPNSIVHIGNMAFRACDSLTSVTIPERVRSIGNGVFTECENLTSITIPKSTAYLGANPFLGSGVCYIISKSVFFETDDFCLYTKGKKKIIAFINKDVSHFSIPNSVTSIGSYAFNSCSLLSITIPDSTTFIGQGAFWGCDYLTSVTISDSITYIGDYAFPSHNNLSLKIPRGSRQKFVKMLPSDLHPKLIEQDEIRNVETQPLLSFDNTTNDLK